ncbi:hypothetical protein EV121DRAFT_290768 [Schizophyllum commune]
MLPSDDGQIRPKVLVRNQSAVRRVCRMQALDMDVDQEALQAVVAMAEPTLPLDVLTRIADDLLAFRNERNSDIIKYGDMGQDLRQAQAAAAALASSGSRVLRDRINPMLYQSPRFWTTHEMYLFRRTLGRDGSQHARRNTENHGLAFMVRRLILAMPETANRNELHLHSLDWEERKHHFVTCISFCVRLTSLIIPFAADHEIRDKVANRPSLVELGLVVPHTFMGSNFLCMESLSTYASAGAMGRQSARIRHLSVQNYSYYPEREHIRHDQLSDLTLDSLSFYRGNLSKRSLHGLLASSFATLTRLSIDFGGDYPGGHITTDDFRSKILSLVRLQHLSILTDGFRRRQNNDGRLRTAGMIDELAPQLLQLQSLEFDEDLATTALFENMPATIKVLRIVHPTHIHPTNLPLLAAQAVRRPQLALRRVVVIWRDDDRDIWKRVGGATTDLLAVQGITLRSSTEWYVHETFNLASSSPHLRGRCLQYPHH